MRVFEHEWYESYLQPDEEIRWQGCPDKHELGAGAEVAKGAPMLLMLGWGGYILYMVLSDSNADHPLAWGFCGLVVVWMLIAFFIGFGKPLLAMHRLRRVEYVITSRRILRKMGRAVDALDSRSMPSPYLRKGAMHYGTITFGAGSADRDARYTRHPSLALAASFELRAIPEAAKVLQIIAGMEKNAPPVKPLSDQPLIPLEKDERVLWQGRPGRYSLPMTFTMNLNSDKLLGGVWATLLPAALLAALLWLRVPAEVYLIATPFWCVMIYGLHCLGLFSLRIHRQMDDEEYVITDRRVLRRIKRKITEHTVTREDTIFLAQGREGCGTVVIGNVKEAHRKAARSRNYSLANAQGFQLRAIPDPARAMDALSALIPSADEEE